MRVCVPGGGGTQGVGGCGVMVVVVVVGAAGVASVSSNVHQLNLGYCDDDALRMNQ